MDWRSKRHPSMRSIYLDNHATTPTDPRVLASLHLAEADHFGEHATGEEAANAISHAAAQVAALVGASSEQVFFSGSATEAIRLAIDDAVWRTSGRRLRVVATAIEHGAVLNLLRGYATLGLCEVEIVGVDEMGRLNLDAFEAGCRSGQDLACVMAANNEVGTVQPFHEAIGIARANGVAFLLDATQAAGRIPLDLRQARADYAILSGHKLYGPQGVGALVMAGGRSGLPSPTLPRGTPNTPAIVGMGIACALRAAEMDADEAAIAALRDDLQRRLLSNTDAVVNGDESRRLAGNLSISFLGVPNGALLARLWSLVAVSTGAACSSGVDEPSHVLRAMGLSPDRLESVLRIGVGRFNTSSEIEEAADHISFAVAATRRAMSARLAG